jgi:hypothetical protein
MKRSAINASMAVILGLGIGLALVYAWGSGSVPAEVAGSIPVGTESSRPHRMHKALEQSPGPCSSRSPALN